ncbi:FtsX-like permease family protein [Rhizomonospora bruguierae]|uniref:FtsX-like permease family protein n=1 Tax=Rhizomonospora bruguierae TaxID=1581705 RepID=UPI001BD05F64|nr:FtsX-like permease family protein [Micromonospora sp. NBRC 107566]
MSPAASEFVGSWRTALRIARRASWRHRRRSGLVLLMLFLPAFAATVLVVSWANLSGTSAQEITFGMGRADLIVEADDLAAVRATLPAGSRTAPLVQGHTVVHGPAGLRAREYEATDLTDPINRGRYVLRAGRAPDGTAEAAVTRFLAAELGVGLGSQIEAGMPQRRLTVVAVVDWSRSLRQAGLLVPAEAPLSGARPQLMVEFPAGQSWSPPDPGTVAGLGWRDRRGMELTAAERAVEVAAALLVASFAGAQVVLLSGAAFMVGARRQRRELALVAAAGATARQLRRIVLAGGLLLGGVAAAAGAVLGLVTFASARPVIELIANHPLIDVSVPVWSVVAVAAVTAMAGMLAAWLPARTAGRRPVRADLGGQRSRSRADLLSLGGGLVLLAAGTGLLLWSGNPEGRPEALALGGVAELLGVVACAPALVRAAGRLAAALPLSGRLALRHAARYRLRTAAAMAAVAAAIAGSAALAVVAAARGDTAPARLAARPGQVLLPAEAADLLGQDGLRRLAATLPARDIVVLANATNVAVPIENPSDERVDPATLASLEQRGVAIGGAETIRLITGRAATTAELATLANAGAVVFNDTLIAGDHVTLAVNTHPAAPLPAVLAARGEYFVDLPGLVVTAATAQRLGLTVARGTAIVDTHRPPTAAELAAANDVLLRSQVNAAHPPAEPITVAAVPAGADSGRTTTMFYLLAAVSAMVTLVASTVAAGLSATELHGDLATMAAVGATPRIRRKIIKAQALLIVGPGALLGVLAGLGTAAGFIGYSTETHWQTPWSALLLITTAPPALAALIAGFPTRSGLPLTRRTT